MMQIRRATRDDVQIDMEQRLSAAYAGDTTAIAAMIERSLLPSRVAVEARIDRQCLYLTFYGQVEQQDSLVRFIKSGLQQIRITGVSELDIGVYDSQADQAEPLWSYHGQLSPSPELPTLVASKKIPASGSPRRVMTGAYSTQWTANGIRIDGTSSSPQRWKPQSVTAPTASDLFDRQAALHHAVKVIQSGKMLQVYGPSGVGKTTLLRTLAQQHEVQQQFGDGIIYIDAYKALSTDLLQHLFECLYRSDNAVPTKPTLSEIRQGLRSRNGLVMVDQTEVVDSADALIGTVPLVLASPDCLLLDQGDVLPLNAFSDHEALTFIELQLDRPLAPDEQRAALELSHHLEGNPALLIQHTDVVRRRQSSFAELTQQIDAGFSPDALIMRAASDLTDEERRLLATLAVFGPVALQSHHLQAIAGVDGVSLTDLQARGLVWGIDDAYRLASNLLLPLQQVWELDPWYERAIHYFCSWATAQHERIPVSGEAATPDTLAILDALWRLVERSVERQQWDEVIRLCHALDPLLYQYCRWGRWQQVWKLGRQAAHELGDRPTEAWALHQLGSVALCLDDGFAAQAYLAEAQQLRLQGEDMVGAALAQHNLAVVQQQLTRDVPRSDVAAAPAAAFVSMSQNLPYKWLALGGGALMAGVGALFGLQATSSDVSVRPRLVNFPPQLLSTTSASRDIVVRNTTSEAITIDAIVLDGDDGNGAGDDSVQEPPSEAGTEAASELPDINIVTGPDGIVTGLDGDEDSSSTRNGNFEIQDNCTGNILLPDATCTIDARFMPQTVGPHASAITIIDDGQTLKTVTLRGVGAVAEAGFRPQTLEFESFILEEDPVIRTVTLRNEGAVAFTVDTVSLSQTPAFSVKEDACTGQTLDTRDTCAVSIEFSPSEAGAFDATLTVNNQTRSSIWTLPISGTAQTAPSPTPGASSSSPRLGLPTLRLPSIFPRSNSSSNPGPRSSSSSSSSSSSNATPTPRARPKLEASANAITFASQPTGRMQTQQITLNNTGAANLYFDAISLSDGDSFTIAGTTCGLLKPGESCRVVVNFVPQTAGEFTSALDISSNIDIAPIPVTGVATAVPRSPEILEFSPSKSTVEPGEAVELCYDVANADMVSLRTGETTRSLQNTSECLSVSPQVTTTYTLIVQSGDERREESVTVTVEEAAVPPLSTPVSLSPGTPNGVEPVACGAGSVVLQWQGSAPTYDVRLQEEAMVDGAPSWVSVLSQSVTQQQLDVSASVNDFGLHRWQVRALDDTGNGSEASAWHYFLCGV